MSKKIAFQNSQFKLFALSRLIQKNRSVAQVFSFVMGVCIYGLVMLQAVSNQFCKKTVVLLFQNVYKKK